MSRSPRHERLEQFIVLWQTSPSLGEVARIAGISEASAATKAYQLRKRGVPMKYFSRGPSATDYEALSELASSLTDDDVKRKK